MNISITNIVESIKNPNGMFATLVGIYPVFDNREEPVMTVHGPSVDFEVVYNKTPYILKCLYGKEANSDRLKELSMLTRLSGSPYLSTTIFLAKELTIFDSSDSAHQIDILLCRKPEGTALLEVLKTLSEHSSEYTAILINNFYELASWMVASNFAHGRISLNNIIISPSLQPVMINYSCNKDNLLKEDLRSIVKICAIFYAAACAPDTFLNFISNHEPNADNINTLLSQLNTNEIRDRHPELSKLLDSLSGAADNKTICKNLKSIRDCSFAPCELISDLIKCSCSEIPSVKTESYVREKLARYSFVSEMCDMMIRVFDGELWHFLDKNGEVVITNNFINADDFSEGRAVVETETGFGLIDHNGNFVLAPEYDDVEWDSNDNIAIVTKDGLSAIYTRGGENVTGFAYDMILKPAEGLIPAKKNGLFGYIRKSGSIAIGFMYEDAFSFCGGVARVKVRGRDRLIDIDGNQIETI